MKALLRGVQRGRWQAIAYHYILFTVKIAIEDRMLLCDVNIANLSSVYKD